MNKSYIYEEWEQSNPLDPQQFFEKSSYNSLFKQLSEGKSFLKYSQQKQIINKKPQLKKTTQQIGSFSKKTSDRKAQQQSRKNNIMRQKFLSEIDGYFKRKDDATFDRKFLELLE